MACHLRTNFMAFGGVFSGHDDAGLSRRRLTFAGQLIADRVRHLRIEITAKLPEQDRANVAAGQAVEVSVDALPEATLRGTVRPPSAVSRQPIRCSPTPAPGSFDISFDVSGHHAGCGLAPQRRDSNLRPRLRRTCSSSRGTAVFDVAGKSDGLRAHRRWIRAAQRDPIRASPTRSPIIESSTRTRDCADQPESGRARGRSACRRPPRLESSMTTRCPFEPIHDRAMDTRSRPQHRQPAAAQVAHAADHARDDLRVAAVLSMLSIGAGAQQQVMAFIQGLGVSNLIVEARETTEWQAIQKVRQQSPGLSFQDMRAIQASVPGPGDLVAAQTILAHPRRAEARQADFRSSTASIPTTSRSPASARDAAASITADEAAHARPGACSARRHAGGCSAMTDPLGQFVKINQQWFDVVGIAGSQAAAQSDVAGVPGQDRNNLIYVPHGVGDASAARTTTASSATRSTASHPVEARRRYHRLRGDRSRHPFGIAPGRRRLFARSCRRNCWPSSSAPSGFSIS